MMKVLSNEGPVTKGAGPVEVVVVVVFLGISPMNFPLTRATRTNIHSNNLGRQASRAAMASIHGKL